MAESDKPTGEAPKIHIDSDWKAQAQAEKQRLAEKAKASEAQAPPGAGAATAGAKPGARGMPKASFETLVSNLASQALLFLGAIPDPRTGQRIQHLELARHHIDTLAVIQDKTKGNLSDEEAQLLSSTLYELRDAYIRMSDAARKMPG